jgi:hypothetical protein
MVEPKDCARIAEATAMQPHRRHWGLNIRHFDERTPVPGEEFEYGFDDIGNRTLAQSGGDQPSANLHDWIYTTQPPQPVPPPHRAAGRRAEDSPSCPARHFHAPWPARRPGRCTGSLPMLQPRIGTVNPVFRHTFSDQASR